MTGRDPAVQAAVDAAARELARRLEAYVPSPPEVTAHGRRDPEIARRGAARARAALEGNRDA